MKIHNKLMQIQMELKCNKSQYNSFGKYSYRSCEDILEALKPLLAKHKVTIFISDKIVQLGERYYVEATVKFYDCEDETEPIIVTAYAREEESKKGADGSQVTGASSSYARKYALNGLFAIDDTKDSDSTNTGNDSTVTNNTANNKKPVKTAQKQSQGISEDAKTEINTLLMQFKVETGQANKATLVQLETALGYSVGDASTDKQAKEIINLLKTWLQQKRGETA